MRKISYQDQVEQAVFRRPAGQLFVAAVLYQEDLREVPEFTYYKALERMVSRNKLLRLARGIYIRPEVTLGQQEIEREIVRYYTEPRGKYCWGFCSGDYLTQKYHLFPEEEKAAKELIICTARMPEQRKLVQGITLTRLEFLPNTAQVPYFELMELLWRYDNYAAADTGFRKALVQRAEEIAKTYTDKTMISVIKQRHYPKHTIALAEKILADMGCETGLRERFLPGTSKYRIPC